MQQIENYTIVPIGRSKDLVGQIFGDYKVLYRTDSKNSQTQWLCQCVKCLRYAVKTTTSLSKGANECNCKYNLLGQQFGRWTVIDRVPEKTKNRGAIWKCQCECGTIKNVPADTLRRGESRSCGCYQKEKASENGRKCRLNITGQRFGKLVALQPIYSNDKNIHTKWICQCDCGNQCQVDLGNLRQGLSQSCGCSQSREEEKIIKLFTESQLSFVYQFTPNDLPGKKFDFFVDVKYIVEFDGQQHFYYTGSGWDTEEHYNRTHKNDLLKNQYCFTNNIPLIRIPYYTEYNLNDLKLETTRFLLTAENEEEYYTTRSK